MILDNLLYANGVLNCDNQVCYHKGCFSSDDKILRSHEQEYFVKKDSTLQEDLDLVISSGSDVGQRP